MAKPRRTQAEWEKKLLEDYLRAVRPTREAPPSRITFPLVAPPSYMPETGVSEGMTPGDPLFTGLDPFKFMPPKFTEHGISPAAKARQPLPERVVGTIGRYAFPSMTRLVEEEQERREKGTSRMMATPFGAIPKTPLKPEDFEKLSPPTSDMMGAILEAAMLYAAVVAPTVGVGRAAIARVGARQAAKEIALGIPEGGTVKSVLLKASYYTLLPVEWVFEKLPMMALKGAGKVFQFIAEIPNESKAYVIKELVVRAASGEVLPDAELAVLRQGVTKLDLHLLDEFLNDAGAQALKETSGAQGYISQAINKLFREADVEILGRGHPSYKDVQEAGRGMFSADLTDPTYGRIMVNDRIQNVGLHELGHKTMDMDIPEYLLKIFDEEFAAFQLTEKGAKALATEGRYHIKDRPEIFADKFKKAARGLFEDEDFPRFMTGLDNWFRVGAPSANRNPITLRRLQEASLEEREELIGVLRRYLEDILSRGLVEKKSQPMFRAAFTRAVGSATKTAKPHELKFGNFLQLIGRWDLPIPATKGVGATGAGARSAKLQGATGEAARAYAGNLPARQLYQNALKKAGYDVDALLQQVKSKVGDKEKAQNAKDLFDFLLDYARIANPEDYVSDSLINQMAARVRPGVLQELRALRGQLQRISKEHLKEYIREEGQLDTALIMRGLARVHRGLAPNAPRSDKIIALDSLIQLEHEIEASVLPHVFQVPLVDFAPKSFPSIYQATGALQWDDLARSVTQAISEGKATPKLSLFARHAEAGAAQAARGRAVSPEIQNALDVVEKYSAGRWGAAAEKVAGSATGLRRLPNEARKELYAALEPIVGKSAAKQMRDWRPTRIKQYLFVDNARRQLGKSGTIEFRGAKGISREALGERYIERLEKVLKENKIEKVQDKGKFLINVYVLSLRDKAGKILATLVADEEKDVVRIGMIEARLKGQGYAEALLLSLLRTKSPQQVIRFEALLTDGVRFLQALEGRGVVRLKSGWGDMREGADVFINRAIINDKGMFTDLAKQVLGQISPKKGLAAKEGIEEFVAAFGNLARAESGKFPTSPKYQEMVRLGQERFGLTLDDLRALDYDLVHGYSGEVINAEVISEVLSSPRFRAPFVPLGFTEGGIWRAAKGITKEMPAVDEGLTRIVSSQPKMSPNEMVMTWWGTLKRHMIDDMYGITKLRGTLKAAGKDLKDIDAAIESLRLLQGASGRTEVFLRGGTFRPHQIMTEKGKFAATGEPLEKILKDLRKVGDLEHFNLFLAAARTVPLNAKGKWVNLVDLKISPLLKEKMDTGAAMTPKQLAAVKKAIQEVLPRETAFAKQVLKELKESFPQFPKLAQRVYKYNRSLLQYLYDSNGLSSSLFQVLKNNLEYVPLHRMMSPSYAVPLAGGGKVVGKVPSAIKSFSGRSTLPLISPMENVVKNTHVLINLAERNNVATLLGNVFRRTPGLDLGVTRVAAPKMKITTTLEELGVDLPMLTTKQKEEFHSLFRSQVITKDGIMTILNRGKREFYKINDPDLAKSLLEMERGELALALQVLGAPARWLRAGAIFNPDFMVKNPIRDQWSAFVNSNWGFVPIVDPLIGLAHMLRRDDMWKLYYASGAARSTMQEMDRAYFRHTPKTLMQRFPQLTASEAHPVAFLRLLSESGEQMTRVGAFSRAIRNGASVREAAIEARQLTLDFAVMGKTGRKLNALIPFFNANIRDWEKLVSMHIEHPIRTPLRLIASITVPSIWLMETNMYDPRWEHIPQYQKDLFWIVFTEQLPENWEEMSIEERLNYTSSWTGNGIIRIPKPFNYGLIYGSLVERFMEWINKKDPKVFREWFETFKDTGVPAVMPQIGLPWFENQANYSMFRSAPIVPRSLENMPNKEQYVTWTSETAKWLGAGLNYSPAKIDNLISGYSAGMGRYVTTGIDKVLEGLGIINPPPKPTPEAADVLFKKALAVRSPYGASDALVREFYDTLAELTQGERHLKRLLFTNKSEEYVKYRQEHPELAFGDPYYEGKPFSATARAYRKASDEIQKIQKALLLVYEDREATPEEKRRAIDELNMMISEISKDILVKLPIGK